MKTETALNSPPSRVPPLVRSPSSRRKTSPLVLLLSNSIGATTVHESSVASKLRSTFLETREPGMSCWRSRRISHSSRVTHVHCPVCASPNLSMTVVSRPASCATCECYETPLPESLELRCPHCESSLPTAVLTRTSASHHRRVSAFSLDAPTPIMNAPQTNGEQLGETTAVVPRVDTSSPPRAVEAVESVPRHPNGVSWRCAY